MLNITQRWVGRLTVDYDGMGGESLPYSHVIHPQNPLSPFQRFAAVIMRIRDPKTTALIFASGKMVVTGAKSEEQSRLASRKYARIIQKLGFAAKFQDFKIQNIVGSCDVKFPIRLEGLAYAHGHFSSVSSNSWNDDDKDGWTACHGPLPFIPLNPPPPSPQFPV